MLVVYIRNVPLSISIAVPVITGLYVFMNVAYMTVMSYAEMTSLPAVAVTFGARVLGKASFLIPLGVAVSTFGCAMSVQFGVTRVCYTAAQGGHMLELFSYVNMRRLTPAPAVAFQVVPCFIVLVAIFLSVLPIVHDPSTKYLIAVGSLLVGFAVYTLFVYYKKTPTRLLSKLTFLTQVLFEAVPPSSSRQD
ncbi:amino acid permease domain-containing protein [Phthorimaea operculella]|nr:amino acid permease domain-containing protein [Phthorimaea operculella]